MSIDPRVSNARADEPAPVLPTQAGSATPSEGPHLTSTARRRNILLAVIFLPPIGAILAWLSPAWPNWARIVATLWAILVLGAALGLALDVFGSRQQTNVGTAAAIVVAR